MADPNSRRYQSYQSQNQIPQTPLMELYRNLPTQPEFLFHEEAVSQRRSWSENLQFYTGAMYLTGAVLGGAKGTVSALRAAEPGDSLKLRLNGVLNAGGQTGRKYGNNLGILGVMYAGLESAIIHYRGGEDDELSCVLAGLGTGAIYKAASGPRGAALAGAIGGLAAGAAVAGKQFIFPAIKRYVKNVNFS